MQPKWVFLDDEGEIVRVFNYAHEGAIEIKEPELSFDEIFKIVGECLL